MNKITHVLGITIVSSMLSFTGMAIAANESVLTPEAPKKTFTDGCVNSKTQPEKPDVKPNKHP